MSVTHLFLALAPILIILVALIVFRQAADLSALIGWAAVSAIAFLFFHTSLEVILRSTLSGMVRSFSVSLIVAMSLLQMAYMERTGALQRIIVFLKTLSSENRAIEIMMINIGFGTLMVAVGATPVSILPPILLALGYSTRTAIALPAIGYDSLCTYALLGAPIVIFVDIANSFLGKGSEISLREAGTIFCVFLPVVSTMIGFCMLWIVGRMEMVRQGWFPCILTGAVIGLVSYITNQYDNLVVLTGVIAGMAVIASMAGLLLLSGKKLMDRSRLTPDDVKVESSFELWRALTPWLFLVGLILALNVPKESFDYLYRSLKMPIEGLTADGKSLDTRALWQAYTWILVSTLLSIPFIRPTGAQISASLNTWLKRAPRPVFAAAVFFSIGEIMNMSGFDMENQKFVTSSMIKVLSDYSAYFFADYYGVVVSFIGLFGGFITGSEASTIAMFAKYTLSTGQNLGLPLIGLIVITAGLAFGGGLASVISPAKLQNAAAAIDRIGEESGVMRLAFVFSLTLTSITALFVVLMMKYYGL